VSHCKRGKGLIKVNGIPLELVQPEILRFKVFEPILLLGRARFAGVDMRVRVKGGGHVSQVYGARPHQRSLKASRGPPCNSLLLGQPAQLPFSPTTRAPDTRTRLSDLPAIRQAIAKSLVAFYQKFVDEATKKEIKDLLLSYDRTLLVADPRRCEPKKFGGRAARAKYQKSCASMPLLRFCLLPVL